MNFEKNKDNYEPIGASLTDSKLPKKTKRQTIKITHNPDSGTSNIFIHKRIRSHAQIKPIKREKRDKKKSLVHVRYNMFAKLYNLHIVSKFEDLAIFSNLHKIQETSGTRKSSKSRPNSSCKKVISSISLDLHIPSKTNLYVDSSRK